MAKLKFSNPLMKRIAEGWRSYDITRANGSSATVWVRSQRDHALILQELAESHSATEVDDGEVKEVPHVESEDGLESGGG